MFIFFWWHQGLIPSNMVPSVIPFHCYNFVYHPLAYNTVNTNISFCYTLSYHNKPCKRFPVPHLSLHAFSWFSSGVVSDSLPCTMGKWGHSYESAGDMKGTLSWVGAAVVGSVVLQGGPACSPTAVRQQPLQPTEMPQGEEEVPGVLASSWEGPGPETYR